MEGVILNVGDVIFCQRYSVLTKITIERVTDTQAFWGSTKFKRKVREGGTVDKIGRGAWDSDYYRTYSDEMEKMYQTQVLVSRIVVKLTRLNNYLNNKGKVSFERLTALDNFLSEFVNQSNK